MTTRGEARGEAVARLRESGDPSAALDADLLLAHVCGIGKEELYAHAEVVLGGAQAGAFEELVRRRAEGEPVAYLRGFKEFYGLRVAVDRRVLIPRPETEVLVDAVLEFMRSTGRHRVADVGTGSGAIAVAIAVREPRARVVAIDRSADALEVARVNVRAHGVADRVELRRGDLLAPMHETVDVVAANLPYLRDDVLEHLNAERTSLAFEPREAVVAGLDGLDVIRRAVAQLPERLGPGGAAFFECDPPQAGEIERLLSDAIGARTRVLNDLAGSPRVVEGIRAA